MTKKSVILSFAMVTLMTTFAFSQTPSAAAQPQAPQAPQFRHRGNSDGNQPMAPADVRAAKMTQRLTKQLGLDDATSKKVGDLVLARDKKIDEIIASTQDNKAKSAAMKINHDDFEAKLKGVLSADQFAKYQDSKGHHKGNKDGGADDNKGNN